MDLEPLEATTLQTPDRLIPPEAQSREETFFGFRVGSLGLLVPVDIYCEVIEQVQVNPLPNTRIWFGGLLNLRGNLVPAIDLHRLLGEETPDPKKRRLFTIDKEQLTPDGCAQLARELGLDEAQFRACMDDPKTQAKIDADKAEFKASGAHGLPTIWIGTQKIEGQQGTEALQVAVVRAVGE